MVEEAECARPDVAAEHGADLDDLGGLPGDGRHLDGKRLGALAIVRGREIGVDVEKIRPEFAGEEIAERYFSSKEVDELRRLPDERRAEGFFLCWTRKEAYVKALGEGLRLPLDSFSVSLTPGEPAQLQGEDAHRWSVRSFEPSTEAGMTHVGAVACEGSDWAVQYLNWERLEDGVRWGRPRKS